VLVTSRRAAGFGRHAQISFAQALAHDFVGLGEDSALQQHLALQAGRLGLRMRTRIRLRSFDAVCRMVEAGVGVAVVPAVAAERHARARCASSTDPTVGPTASLLVCARRFEQLSVPALRLVEALCAPCPRSHRQKTKAIKSCPCTPQTRKPIPTPSPASRNWRRCSGRSATPR
jgi:DNA-binding transcriptional LysR family regulator